MPAARREAEALDVAVEPAAAQPVGAAVLERYDAVVDEDPHELLALPASTSTSTSTTTTLVGGGGSSGGTDHLLDVHARGEGDGPAGGEARRGAGPAALGPGQGRRGVVEAEGGVDAGHVVVVAEVGVEAAAVAERERGGVAVERRVGARRVLDRPACEPRDQLVGEPDAARRPQRAAVPVPVPLPQRLVVVVGAPLVGREEPAERRQPPAPVRHRVVRAQVHHGDRLLERQVGPPQQLAVQPAGDRRREDLEPRELRLPPAVGPLFERGAQLVAQRIVILLALGDDQDVVGVAARRRARAPVVLARLVEALGPLPRRVDDPLLAGGTDERRHVPGEARVPAVEVDARVHHLLLPERRQLVRAQRVVVVPDEARLLAVLGHAAVYPLDQGGVGRGLARRRVPRPVAREHLGHRDLAAGRDRGRDLGRDGVVGRVLAPEMRYLGLALESEFRGVT